MPLFFLAAILSVIADQVTKILIRAHLAEGAQLRFLPGFMHLEYVQNRGAAWGFMSGQKWLLIGFTLLVVVMIVSSAREVCARGKLASLGFGLILGGAVGNLTDRILFGHVTDFFDLDTSIQALRTFPVFNVADSALTVGVICMLISLFWQPRTTSPVSSSTP
jgi:signal peptidase II